MLFRNDSGSSSCCKFTLGRLAFVFAIIAGGICLYSLLIYAELSYLKGKDSKIKAECRIVGSWIDGLDLSHMKSAGCLIEDAGRILLVEGAFSFEDFRRWGKVLLPGGTLRSGENPACGAARETQEETGVPVEVVGFAGAASNGFGLFVCKPLIPLDDVAMRYKKAFEVRKLLLVKISDTSAGAPGFSRKLRYPADFDLVSGYFAGAGQ